MHGKTLNAVLFDNLTAGWRIGGLPIGLPIVTFTLITEGALLFVAAQTGFIDGPRVLATMATRPLGAAALLQPERAAGHAGRRVRDGRRGAAGPGRDRARVGVLVVLYAINVFVTFTLSQLGMSVLWWRERKSDPRWKRKLLINGVGCIFTALILTLYA